MVGVRSGTAALPAPAVTGPGTMAASLRTADRSSLKPAEVPGEGVVPVFLTVTV